MTAITLARDGAVATITLHRPQAGNAVDPALAGELTDAATEVADAGEGLRLRIAPEE